MTPPTHHHPARPIDAMPAYFGSEEERIAYVRKSFNETAIDYDAIEKLLGLGSGSWYRRQALLRAGCLPGHRVVDVAVGTGLVAREAAKIVGDPALITGVDPSTGMLANAVVPAGVKLIEGVAEKLPVESATADFLSMGYALRHLDDLSIAFSEFHRVLKPGGRVCLLEITRPQNRLAYRALKIYMRNIVPTLAKLFMRSKASKELWEFYWDTIDACVPSEKTLAALRNAGFEDVTCHRELGIFSEYRATKK
jgi:demethylmenaquinone methyltransferase / 2-methoxy-6-polyprenyl-1,4-benzoquinol methylase